MDDDELDDDDPWTPEAAGRLLDAARAFTTAITAHAEAVARVACEADQGLVGAADEALLPIVLAYADAQFDYTWSGSPFGILHQLIDDAEEGDEEGDADPPASGISVLQRHDYAVTDESAVLAVGRAAYLRVWPDDHESDAVRHVDSLGEALYELAHDGGWTSLDKAPGLQPTGAAVVVKIQEELLSGDSDGWPNDVFSVEGGLLFRQEDIFPA